jgi:hypothetical protein
MDIEKVPCRICGEYELEYFGDEYCCIHCAGCGSYGPWVKGQTKDEVRPIAFDLYKHFCAIGWDQ